MTQIEFPHKIILPVVIVIALIVTLFSGLYTIQPGQVGFQKQFWKISSELKYEWLHFKIPFITSVIKTNTRNIILTTTQTAASKDLQDVTTEIAVNYSINPAKAVELYSTVWREYQISNDIVAKAVQESVKHATSRYTATESITKRSEVRELILSNLTEKLTIRGLNINQVDILDFRFSKAFNNAIEAKVTAEQEALKAKANLEKVKFESQQQIERAKAEAEKIRIQAEAVTSQGGAEYIKLQWIQAWDGKLPATMLGDSWDVLINLK